MAVIPSLEPPTFAELAQHLHDETWLDMRVVDVGTCQRVQINQLNICRDKDEVVVEQVWWREERGDDEIKVESASFTFNAEDVRWLRETQVELIDVEPITQPKAAVPIPMTYDKDALIDVIVNTVAFVHGVDEKIVRFKANSREPYAHTRARQVAMWCVYEMTDLSPKQIAEQRFGFKSQQSMLTTGGNAHNDPKFRSELLRVAEAVESLIGGKPRRVQPYSQYPEWATIL